MENAAFLTEPKIDTSPDALDRVCISLKKFEHETTWMGMAVIYDAAKVLHEVAAEKRRDAELVRELVGALERILNPSPGVAKLPPWVYGIAGAVLVKARAQGGGE